MVPGFGVGFAAAAFLAAAAGFFAAASFEALYIASGTHLISPVAGSEPHVMV